MAQSVPASVLLAGQRRMLLFVALAVVLVLAALVSAGSGAFQISPARFGYVLFQPQDSADEIARRVLFDIRLPRILLGIVVGAGLALAGAALQALFRNPLADPGLIGISAGGALGAVSAIVLGGGAFIVLAPAAFFGSLLATWCAYALGRRSPGMAGLLLAGIAINAICASIIGVFSFIANDNQLRSLTFWNLGSMAQGNWLILSFLVPWSLVFCALIFRQWRALNALLLGEREAWHLGFALERMRRRLIFLVALLVGPLVAATGIIAFVGLVVPHVLRMLVGSDNRWLLPASMLGGAITLVLADLGARLAMAPAELPVGIVTSLVGAPFFLWLLIVRGRAA